MASSLPLSGVAGLALLVPLFVVLRRWCRAGDRCRCPLAACRGGDRLGRAVRLGYGFASGLCSAWVVALAARCSSAAPLTVGGAAASACPRRGLASAGSVGGLAAPRWRRGFRRYDLRGAALLGCMDARRARCPAPPLRLVACPDELGAGGWAFVFVALLGRGVSLLGLTPTPCRYAVGRVRRVALGGFRRVPRASPLPPLLRLPAAPPAVLGLFLAAVRPVVLYGRGGGLRLSLGDWLGV